MKQNVSEAESNWCFRKNVATSTKQEIMSDAAFRACPFSSNFNFVYKDGQVTTVTCKYYCPLVVNPTITNCCKELHHVAEFLDPPLKTSPCMKTSMKTVFFLIISKCCLVYRKSLCF